MGAKRGKRHHVIACLCCDYKVEQWAGMARMIGWTDLTGPHDGFDFDFSGVCPACQLNNADFIERARAICEANSKAFRIKCLHKDSDVYCRHCGKCAKCCRCLTLFSFLPKDQAVSGRAEKAV